MVDAVVGSGVGGSVAVGGKDVAYECELRVVSGSEVSARCAAYASASGGGVDSLGDVWALDVDAGAGISGKVFSGGLYVKDSCGASVYEVV